MHPNPTFRGTSRDKSLEFARDRSFGHLCISRPDAPPSMAHIPFLINDLGTQAELHLVRSNPIARGLKNPQIATIVISGPDSYISPDWYGLDDQVPTWNYVAVHLTGTLTLGDPSTLLDLLDRQSHSFETRLAPKPAWTTGKMTPDVLDRMMRAIVPCTFEIEQIDSTWKLNQNKPDDARLSAADHVENDGIGHDHKTIAGLMRKPPSG